MGTGSCEHGKLWAREAVDTGDRGHGNPWEAVSLGSCGHGKLWAREPVGMGSCGHGSLWAQEVVSTGSCGHGKLWAGRLWAREAVLEKIQWQISAFVSDSVSFHEVTLSFQVTIVILGVKIKF